MVVIREQQSETESKTVCVTIVLTISITQFAVYCYSVTVVLGNNVCVKSKKSVGFVLLLLKQM